VLVVHVQVVIVLVVIVVSERIVHGHGAMGWSCSR
jgi:hypothetical protein